MDNSNHVKIHEDIFNQDDLKLCMADFGLKPCNLAEGRYSAA